MNEVTSEQPWLEVTEVQPGDGQVFDTSEGGKVIVPENTVLNHRCPYGAVQPRRKRADEAGDTAWTRVDYGTPFPCPFIVQGDVEEAMSRSSEPRRCDQRAGFERPVVTGQAVDRVFYEFLRQPHLFDIVQSRPKDNRRKG